MVTVGSEGFRGRVLADHVRDFLFAHDAELKTQTVTVGRVPSLGGLTRNAGPVLSTRLGFDCS